MKESERTDRRGRALGIGDEIAVRVPLHRYSGSAEECYSRHVGRVVGFRVDGVGHEIVDYRERDDGSLRAAIAPWIVRRVTAEGIARRLNGKRPKRGGRR